MIRLVTACNERYLSRMQPYLDSLKKHCQIPVTLITVGFETKIPGVECIKLDKQLNRGSPMETESPQHGSFLQVLDCTDDDIIIFTDGDIVMQRSFMRHELDRIALLPFGSVMAGYNSGPGETLAVEASRLFPRFTIEQIDARMKFTGKPCYNIGVFVARRKDYQRIYEAYIPKWDIVSEAFGGPARQQWLVVHTIHQLGMTVKVTPYSFHANGHYGMPPRCWYRDGVLYSDNEIVLMRHKL